MDRRVDSGQMDEWNMDAWVGRWMSGYMYVHVNLWIDE